MQPLSCGCVSLVLTGHNMEKVLQLPSLDVLNKRFKYDKETGLIYRKTTFKHRKKGDVVGGKHSCGYMTTYIDGKVYFLHRIIWFMMTGQQSKGMVIDHINGIRDDNRFCNLQQITQSQNNLKAKIQKNNVSGHKGIHFNKNAKKWEVYSMLNYKRIYAGIYADLDDAIKAKEKLNSQTLVGFKIV